MVGRAGVRRAVVPRRVGRLPGVDLLGSHPPVDRPVDLLDFRPLTDRPT